MEERATGDGSARVAPPVHVRTRLADQLGQARSSRLADECLAAPGRAVEEKSFGLGELELLERGGMQQRILDRLSNRRDGFLLSADLLPRDVRRFVEHMFGGLAVRQFLDGNA